MKNCEGIQVLNALKRCNHGQPNYRARVKYVPGFFYSVKVFIRVNMLAFTLILDKCSYFLKSFPFETFPSRFSDCCLESPRISWASPARAQGKKAQAVRRGAKNSCQMRKRKGNSVLQIDGLVCCKQSITWREIFHPMSEECSREDNYFTRFSPMTSGFFWAKFKSHQTCFLDSTSTAAAWETPS